MRVGHGYDAHRFGAGDAVVLAGIRVPCEFGVVAHSDGDVILHALCDALLGAAALGDLGEHFPDSDEAFRGADSSLLLAQVLERVAAAGWRPENVDVTLVAQTPRIGALRERMRSRLAQLLGIPVTAVSLKATTTEGMGFAGRREGLAAHAVALLVPA